MAQYSTPTPTQRSAGYAGELIGAVDGTGQHARSAVVEHGSFPSWTPGVAAQEDGATARAGVTGSNAGYQQGVNADNNSWRNTWVAGSAP